MFYLEQIDEDNKIVNSIKYQTEDEAEAGFRTLNFLMESIDLPSNYTYQIKEGKEVMYAIS